MSEIAPSIESQRLHDRTKRFKMDSADTVEDTENDENQAEDSVLDGEKDCKETSGKTQAGGSLALKAVNDEREEISEIAGATDNAAEHVIADDASLGKVVVRDEGDNSNTGVTDNNKNDAVIEKDDAVIEKDGAVTDKDGVATSDDAAAAVESSKSENDSQHDVQAEEKMEEGEEESETGALEIDEEQAKGPEIEMKDAEESSPEEKDVEEVETREKASTSQDVTSIEVDPETDGAAEMSDAVMDVTKDVPVEDAVSEAETVEVSTLEEAKERIGVLEKRLQKEKGLRHTAERHSADLVKQVESLSQEVHTLRQRGSVHSGTEGSVGTHEIGIQTEPECIHISDDQVSEGHGSSTSNHAVRRSQPVSVPLRVPVVAGAGTSAAQHRDWAGRSHGQAASSSSSQSIADNLRATAEAALAQTGVVLDEASGMYYDYNSGYYYDPNNHLYYDPARGIYYYYDDQSQSYQYHSKVDLPEVVVAAAGGSRGQSETRRQERDKRRGDKSRRRRGQGREERTGSERPSTSGQGTEMECEVIDITSPTEDFPENGVEPHSSNSLPNPNLEQTRDKDREKADEDGNDIVEIIVDDDEGSRHRRRWPGRHGPHCKHRRMRSKSDRRENGEETTEIIVIDSDESDMEEGELSDSSSESGASSRGESAEGSEESEESMVIDDDDDDVQSVEATRVDYPPCIRMIVVRSESMKLGSLSVVTCMGGSIGREGSSHILLVPELGVSKTHAQIAYDKEKAAYTITDLGSQNGTVLNGVPLTQKSRMKSDPQPVNHKDYLTFGTTTLCLHIHRGDQTCDECEPGQVQALLRQQKSMEVSSVSQVDKEQQRRRELRKIKKKYLLAGASGGQSEPSRVSSGYKDRAEERRVAVGSDNPYQPAAAPASVEVAISDSNVGHKMLRKMGWKEGESLGKSDSGIKEPIQVFMMSKKAGLGAGGQRSLDSLHMLGTQKSEKWERARKRFHYVDQGTSHHQQGSSSAPMKWVKGGVHVQVDNPNTPQGGKGSRTERRERDVEVVSLEEGEVEEEEEEGNGERSRGDVTKKPNTSPNAKSSAEDDGGAGDANTRDRSNGEDRTKGSSGGSEKGDDSVVGESAEGISPKPNSVSAQGENNASPEGAASKHSAPPSGGLEKGSGEKQDCTDPPGEREAAKKPIKFVIPPRMNTKLGGGGAGGKNPLTAPRTNRPTPENNGEGSSTSRRTRQSSRRSKDRHDKLDMFEDG